MEKIAQEPENRFDWWIMKTFQVLPTSREFQDLTEHQRGFLWHSYLEDNPKLKKRIESVSYDDEFNEEWDRLGTQPDAEADNNEADPNTDDDDEALNAMAEKAYGELQGDERTALESARDRLKKKGISLDDVEDWEEVDD